MSGSGQSDVNIHERERSGDVNIHERERSGAVHIHEREWSIIHGPQAEVQEQTGGLWEEENNSPP